MATRMDQPPLKVSTRFSKSATLKPKPISRAWRGADAPVGILVLGQGLVKTVRSEIRRVLLGKVAHHGAPLDGQRARIRLLQAQEHLEQRGFTRPVGSDQDVAVALVDLKGGPIQENLLTEGFMDAAEGDHDTGKGYSTKRETLPLIFSV